MYIYMCAQKGVLVVYMYERTSIYILARYICMRMVYVHVIMTSS